MSSTAVLTLLLLAVVIVLGGMAGLIVSRSRREVLPPDVLDKITTEAVEHPEHVEPSPQEAEDAIDRRHEHAETPPAERPEAPAGRFVRLRSRLARSQSVFGRGLLAVLSRDRLDDATWDELLDTLVS